MSQRPEIQKIESLIKGNRVALFMKGTPQFPMCGFSARAVEVLKAAGVEEKEIASINVLEDEAVRTAIKEYSNWPTIPQVYVKGQFLGGSDIVMEMYESGELQELLKN
ncbi:MAG TPA: Grx4 family monothiol glutaredoxin [Bdellovibrionota bacterium]|nr:Grx4 family monothiol glutaredoxin [Bdellovibrionota bacterium]